MRAGRQVMHAILESPPRDEVDPVEPTQSALGLFVGRAITLLLVAGPLVAFAHAHVGWLFAADPTAARQYAPELIDDRDLGVVSRLFPVFAIFSFAAPFFLGWLVSGAIGGALTALLWAGVARMALLHHV